MININGSKKTAGLLFSTSWPLLLMENIPPAFPDMKLNVKGSPSGSVTPKLATKELEIDKAETFEAFLLSKIFNFRL